MPRRSHQGINIGDDQAPGPAFLRPQSRWVKGMRLAVEHGHGETLCVVRENGREVFLPGRLANSSLEPSQPHLSDHVCDRPNDHVSYWDDQWASGWPQPLRAA